MWLQHGISVLKSIFDASSSSTPIPRVFLSSPPPPDSTSKTDGPIFLVFLITSDGRATNDTSPLSFVNMAVELVEGGKIMNVKLSVKEKESKLDGALGNTLMIDAFYTN